MIWHHTACHDGCETGCEPGWYFKLLGEPFPRGPFESYEKASAELRNTLNPWEAKP